MALKATSYKSIDQGSVGADWSSVAAAGASGGVAGAVAQGLDNLAGHFIRKGRIEADKAAYDNGLLLGEKDASEAFASGAALKLRDDDTVEGQAYNERALDIFTAKLDTSLNERLATLAQTHKHDPQGYRDAVGALVPSIIARLPENQRANAEIAIEAQTSRKFVELRSEFERQATTTYLARLDLNVKTQLSDLELAAKNPGQFEEGAKKIKAKILPQVPSELREQVEIEFDTLALGGSRRVAKDYQTRIEAENNADLFTTAETAARAANQAWRNGDYDTARAEEVKLQTALEARTDLTPTRKAALAIERQDARNAQLTFGEFERFHAGDPDRAKKFISDFRDDDQGIGPEQKARLANEMESMTADIRAERRLALSDLRDDAKVAVDAVSKGRTFEGWEDLRARAVDLNDAETLAKLDDAAGIMAEAQSFAILPPVEQKERIETLRGSVSSDADNARLDVLEKVAANSARELKRDPIGFAIRNRISGYAPIDVSDLAALAGSVAARSEARRKFMARMGVDVKGVLRKEEATQFVTALDAMPSGERAAMIAVMMTGAGRDAKLLLGQIAEKKPEYGHAGALFGEDPITAANIIAGVEIGQLEGRFVPTKSNWNTSYSAAIPQGAFDAVGVSDRAGIEATVKALYTKMAADANLTDGQVDDGLLIGAIDQVTGGLVEYDADNIPFFGPDSYQTVAPVRGMSSDDFTNLVDGLTEQDLEALPVDASGGKIEIDDLIGQGRLIFVRTGQYLVQFGASEYAATETGEPFVLDLGAIAGRKGGA